MTLILILLCVIRRMQVPFHTFLFIFAYAPAASPFHTRTTHTNYGEGTFTPFGSLIIICIERFYYNSLKYTLCTRKYIIRQYIAFVRGLERKKMIAHRGREEETRSYNYFLGGD